MQTIFYESNKLLLMLFCLTVALLTFDAVQAQESAETKTFVVIGTATLKSTNITTAREKAISESLVTAVALMTEEILQVESLVSNFSQLNDLLFDQTSNFVKDYKVLTEAAHGESYRVVVQVNVSGNKISKQLSDAGILRVQTKLPRVLFLISEQNLEQPSPGFWWSRQGEGFVSVSEIAIAERLKAAGFVIIDHMDIRNQTLENWDAFDKLDPTDQEAAELGSRLEADVIVLGASISNPSTNIMGSAMRSFNGTVTGRVIRANSAESMLNFTRTAVAVNEDDIIGSKEALEFAGDLAGQSLAENLAAAWQKQAGRPSVVEMVIRGTADLASYVKFRKTLNTISGVEGIRVKEIRPNEAILLVEYKGETKDLAAALMLQNFESFGINIFDVAQNALKIELIPG